jgi:hypothetical protein
MSYSSIDSYGNKYWYDNNGRRHREDGPAIEYVDGTEKWCLNGKLHREDGPAIEWGNGDKEWYLNGKCHREDGPAVEREDGPAIEWGDGDKEWWLNGKRHRKGGPAVENINGYKGWWINGKRHREDGPAVIYRDLVEYWICGYEMSEKTIKYSSHIYIMNKIIAYYDCYLNNMCMEIIETIVDKLEEEFLFLSEDTLYNGCGVAL